MNLPIYCDSQAAWELAERVATPEKMVTLGTRAAFRAAAMASGIGVVLTRDLSSDLIEWVTEVCREPPFPRLILSAPISPTAVRLLQQSNLPTIALVWWEELEDRLEDVQERLLGHPVRIIRRLVLAQRPLPPIARRVLEEACDPTDPPTSVAELAHRSHMSPRAVRYHWRASLRASSPPKLFLSWAVLLRALEMRESAGWTRVAYLIGIHRRTIARQAKKLLGTSLGRVDQAEARTRFLDWARRTFDLQIDSSRP